MHNIILLLTLFLTVLATSIMSYVSLITPVGPWIAPLLIMCARELVHWCSRSNESRVSIVGYAVAGGSVGGIMATACAFSLPAFYYHDPALVTDLCAQPFLLCAMLMAIIGGAALMGYVCADLYESVDAVQSLPFALSNLHAAMIRDELSAGHMRRGVIGGGLMLVWQAICMLMRLQFPTLGSANMILPIVICVGYIMSHLLLFPLAVGLGVKLVLQLYAPVTALMSVGAGMVIAAATQMINTGLRAVVRMIKNGGYMSARPECSTKSNVSTCPSKPWRSRKGVERNKHLSINDAQRKLFFCVSIFVCIQLLLFGCTFLQAMYVIGATSVAAYCLVTIAGTVGIAPLGRFATFVMVPALLLFNCTSMQGLLIAACVEIAGGVCADLVTHRKMGHLLKLDTKRVKRYQLWGLLLSVLCMVIICVLLVTCWDMHTIAAYASRARARALLLQAPTYAVQFPFVLGGFFLGLFMHTARINVLLMLSGLLMPPVAAVGLLLGGCAAYCGCRYEQWYSSRRQCMQGNG